MLSSIKFVLFALATFTATSHAQASFPIERPSVNVGDHWRYQRVDLFKNEIQGQPISITVDKIDGKEIRFKHINQNAVSGTRRQTLDYNWISSYRGEPQVRMIFQWPLAVGANWDYTFKYLNQWDGTSKTNCKVQGKETLKVLAGEFEAVKIFCRGFWTTTVGGDGSEETTVWYAPVVKQAIKTVYRGYFRGNVDVQWSEELIDYTQASAPATLPASEANNAQFATLTEADIKALIVGKRMAYMSSNGGRCNVDYGSGGRVFSRCEGGEGSGVYSIGRFTPKGVADEKAMARLCTNYTSLGREPDCTALYRKDDGTYWGWNKKIQMTVE
jgi:hypothetical protein